MNRNTGTKAGQVIGTMNGQQVIGLDIAKPVFQLYTVDMNTGEMINVQPQLPRLARCRTGNGGSQFLRRNENGEPHPGHFAWNGCAAHRQKTAFTVY